MVERRDTKGERFHLGCHGGIVSEKEVFDELGRRQKEVTRFKDLIHVTVTMKRFITSVFEIFGRDEESLCPFDEWKG